MLEVLSIKHIPLFSFWVKKNMKKRMLCVTMTDEHQVKKCITLMSTSKLQQQSHSLSLSITVVLCCDSVLLHIVNVNKGQDHSDRNMSTKQHKHP